MAVVAVWAGLPHIASAMWPSAAKYFPPSLLSILVLGSSFYALLVWRSEWLLSRMFPGVSGLDISGAQYTPAKAERLGAAIGLVVSGLLVTLWVRSVL
jgi:hypothetical protein